MLSEILTTCRRKVLVRGVPAAVTNKPPQFSSLTNAFLLTCSSAGVSAWQAALFHAVTQGSRIRTRESSVSRRKLKEMMEEIRLLLNLTGLEVTHILSTDIPVVRTSHLSARSAGKCHLCLAATTQL